MSRCKDKYCPSDKICNPASGRCVQKDGKIGMALVQNHKKASSKKSSPSRKLSRTKRASPSKQLSRTKMASPSKKLSRTKRASLLRQGHNIIVEDFGYNVKEFTDEYVNIKKLGAGEFGSVFLGTKPNGKKEVIKVHEIQNLDDFEHEYKMGKKFGQLEISPKIISKHGFEDEYYGTRYGIIKMGLIDGTLDNLFTRNATKELIDYVFDELMNLLAYMCEHNLIHGDFHPGNIGYLVREDKSGNVFVKFQVIDHGYACCIRDSNLCEPDLEVTQLIRCIKTTDLTTEMKIYLTQKLLDFYMLNYNATEFIPKGFKIKNSKDLNMVISKFSEKYITLHNEYLKDLFDKDIFEIYT